MSSVLIAGSAMLPVVRGTGASERELATMALQKAVLDADVGSPTALFVGSMLASAGTEQRQLACAVADSAGLLDVEAVTVEAACASGAAAVRAAYLAVASGAHDRAVAIGVERMTRFEKRELARELATASDWELEGRRGETFLSLNAALTSLYLERHALDEAALSPFPRIAHRNAVRAPHALYREPIDEERYRSSRIVEGPLRLYDVAPVCDGAAAVLLCRSDSIAKGAAARIRIRASTVATDRLAMSTRRDPLELRAARISSARAFEQAGLRAADVDFFEPHDAYSVLAALSLEAAGFAPNGEAHRHAAEGRFDLEGDLPILTQGGLKARGHPVGASGVYQLAEACRVLRGEIRLGERAPRLGMTQSFGGTAATVFTHLLERID